MFVLQKKDHTAAQYDSYPFRGMWIEISQRSFFLTIYRTFNPNALFSDVKDDFIVNEFKIKYSLILRVNHCHLTFWLVLIYIFLFLSWFIDWKCLSTNLDCFKLILNFRKFSNGF